MNISGTFLFGLFLAYVATGCESLEHNLAVKQGNVPWYVVTITSPDMEILEGEMSIYKLLRKADSPEGKKDKLKADKRWGEGHRKIEASDNETITTHVQISQDHSDPKTCYFQLNAFYLHEKEQFHFSLEANKSDRCEKSEFKNPYFSGQIQTEDRQWKTLNFRFRRAGIGQ